MKLFQPPLLFFNFRNRHLVPLSRSVSWIFLLFRMNSALGPHSSLFSDSSLPPSSVKLSARPSSSLWVRGRRCGSRDHLLRHLGFSKVTVFGFERLVIKHLCDARSLEATGLLIFYLSVPITTLLNFYDYITNITWALPKSLFLFSRKKNFLKRAVTPK